MNRPPTPWLSAAALGLLLAGSQAWSQGQEAEAPDMGLMSLLDDKSVYFSDFKSFMTAPAHWTRREWTQLGGLLVATRIAYEYDYDVREHFVPEPQPSDYHDVEDLIPVGLMLGATWWSARRNDDIDRFGEARAMVRAGVLSTTSTLVFKLGFGRERPDEGVERDDWWSGGRSMPSGHTALAFAVGTVFAESGTPKRRWVRRAVGYGLGVSMMYWRVKHDSHWFSDTVPGAAIGIAAGRAVLERSGESDGRTAFSAAPLEGGALLTFSVALD